MRTLSFGVAGLDIFVEFNPLAPPLFSVIADEYGTEVFLWKIRASFSRRDKAYDPATDTIGNASEKSPTD